MFILKKVFKVTLPMKLGFSLESCFNTFFVSLDSFVFFIPLDYLNTIATTFVFKPISMKIQMRLRILFDPLLRLLLFNRYLGTCKTNKYSK